MHVLDELLAPFLSRISKDSCPPNAPETLYAPIDYLLNMGGKRVRPALVLAAAAMQRKQSQKEILILAEVVEMFHNFTLMHDDIMDNADTRRGNPTVHKKWNVPTAILSGDLLLIQVYAKLGEINHPQIFDKFNKMAIALCEGQMMDMEFETQEIVSNEDYLLMIEKKTAVLLAFALEGGGILAGLSEDVYQKLHSLGINIGLAFQLMDDYLDSFGEKASVGKRIGGDILEQKKTFLWNGMWQNISETRKKVILEVFKNSSEEEIIRTVKQEMKAAEMDKAILSLANDYATKAAQILEQLKGNGDTFYLSEIMTLLAGRSK